MYSSSSAAEAGAGARNGIDCVRSVDVAARERKSRRRRWLRRGEGRGGDTEEEMMVGLCGGGLGLRRVAVAEADAIVGTRGKGVRE